MVVGPRGAGPAGARICLQSALVESWGDDGGAGGHNGLASIIEQLETENFPRLRLGIGPLPDDLSVVDFVLGQFEKEQHKVVDEMIMTASEAATFVINDGIDEAIKKYNKNPA